LCEICEEHTGIVAKFNDCNYLMCRSCDKGHNKTNPGHTKISLEQIVKEIQDRMKVSQEKCQKLIDSSKCVLDDLERTTEEVTKQKTSALDQIEQSRRETINLVNKKHDQLKNKLISQVSEYNKTLQDSKKNIENMMKNFMILIRIWGI
jgi:small-conductance mechanosensitive channel